MDENGEPSDVYSILRIWEEESQNPNHDPIPVLTTLAEIIEVETEVYLKLDPDPFDERHPSRAYPNCGLGVMLKHLFKKENFMIKLVNDYLRDNYYSRLGINRDVRSLNTAACRLMLDVIPGLDMSAVFDMPANDALVHRLFSWSEKSQEPLQTFSTGLLAAAMDVQGIATAFREQNMKIVPLMLERLQEEPRSFAEVNDKDTSPTPTKKMKLSNEKVQVNGTIIPPDDSCYQPSHSGQADGHCVDGENSREWSSSSWIYLDNDLIGSVQMNPVTPSTSKMFILRYLSAIGEYQEFLSHVFEKNALDVILRLINMRETKNARLSFEALRYLASLLCHKKFAIEFIHVNGLQKLLDVPRPGRAATGVSMCLYYLAHCEEAIERVCLLSKRVISQLSQYALWLLECSHDSGRCHATMFFGLSFQFKVILDEFDKQDGLRKLYNVISTLAILRNEDVQVSEDEECSSRQIVRHVCVALRKYLEAHLYLKAEEVRRAHLRDTNLLPALPLPSYKALKSSPEEVREQIKTLLELMSFRAQWPPADNMNHLGGITLLLRIIALSYEWNYSGRAETVRCALDVLCICTVMARTQLQLCEKVELPDENNMVGLHVILGAAEGEIVADAEVQRSALHVIITCVCAPRVGGVLARYSLGGSAKKKTMKSSEEVIEKVWECLRTTNGIMVLLNLISVKMPITDADSIRGLACRALCGLARSETVRQIIGKLPLFTTGQLQNLMKDPILQDRRQEHAIFQKYALELLERVSGKSKPPTHNEPSLANIHRANVIAQTRIQYNDKELLELIYSHLEDHGFQESASTLQKEAGLPPKPPLSIPSPFTYIDHQSRIRHKERKPSPPPALTPNSTKSPIRLNLSANRKEKSSSGRSLEKRWSTRAKTPPRVRQVTLDSIITEYLTNQHALCTNPMATCPQFSLFQPHKCPDPKGKNAIPVNFTVRYSQGVSSRRHDQRLIHSRFTCVHSFRYTEDNAFFTCCDFTDEDNYIVIGTQHGEVKLFNLHTGNEVSASSCHESYITHVQCSMRKNLLLTSSTWRMPLSACWNLDNRSFSLLFSMESEEYVEFSKLSEDRVIGTKAEKATIYDIETGQNIQELNPSISNQYTKNRATFSPTDELVLSDGVLWDVNSNRQIHKFDKLNQTLSGIFHPNGYELVSNTEVWDLRTFHLLRTVPALDQSEVQFSPTADIIYSVSLEKETEEDLSFESSFKTLDAYDYTSIATIDVKKNIYDLSCNRRGTQIALVENQGVFESVQESVVKIYDIGRARNTVEDPPNNEEDDDEEELNGSEDNSTLDEDPQNDSLLDWLDDDVDQIIGNDSSSSSPLFSSPTFSTISQNSDDDEDNDDDDS